MNSKQVKIKTLIEDGVDTCSGIVRCNIDDQYDASRTCGAVLAESSPPCGSSAGIDFDDLQLDQANHIRCSICALGPHNKFGQGEMLKFYSSEIPILSFIWSKDVASGARRLPDRGKSRIQQQGNMRTEETSATTPPEYCCLDTNRRERDSKIIGTDGKPCLSGIMNAFVDGEGRPFGLIDELAQVGLPAAVTVQRAPCTGGTTGNSNSGGSSGSGTSLNWRPGQCEQTLDKLKFAHLLSYESSPSMLPATSDSSCYYAHHCCAAWSEGVTMTDQENLENVEAAVRAGIMNTCAFCLRLGATIACRSKNCRLKFHYPCAAAAGCFQDFVNLQLWCPNHTHEADFSNEHCICSLCERKGGVNDLISCTSCGQHYHSNCLEPPLILSPTVRAGWQCAECKTCLVCSESKDEKKMLVCDVCDKGFHTYCLQPPMAAIPKNGWKCDSCRVCNDCGFYCRPATASTTITSGVAAPGAAGTMSTTMLSSTACSLTVHYTAASGIGIASSAVRWHNNYTLCDRCAQTKRRGHSICAVCERAWRCALSSPNQFESGTGLTGTSSSSLCPSPKWPGRKCTSCHKMVHLECDPIAMTNSASTNEDSCLSACGGGPGGVGYQCPACLLHHGGCLGTSGGGVETVGGSASSSEAASTRTSPMPGSYGDDELGADELATELDDGDDDETASMSGFDPLPARMLGLDGQCDAAATAALLTRDGSSCSVGGGGGSGGLLLERGGCRSNSVDNDSSTISGSTTPQTYCQSTSSSKFHPPACRNTATTAAVSSGNTGQLGASLSMAVTSAAAATIPLPGNGCNGTAVYQRMGTSTVSCSSSSSTLGAATGTVGGAKKKTQQPSSNKGKAKSANGKATSLKRGGNILNSKRSRRAKARKINVCESKGSEEKDEHPSTVVLCRADDRFVLEQDICVSCGSFGLDTPMLCCVQCGQCYHTFCAEISKLTKVIIEKGWRCLDCTVCEGCGQVTNEELLLLCDDCDISYHTFCLDPPLNEVPKGSWKCQNCVLCQSCGKREPGPNSTWQNNYTSCGPCASKVQCPVCYINYNEGDLMLICDLCDRSSHASCDQLNTEAELEFIFEGGGYHCVLCREKGIEIGIGHKQLLQLRATHGDSVAQSLVADKTVLGNLINTLDCGGSGGGGKNTLLGTAGTCCTEEPVSPEPTKNFFMDNVVLSEDGLNAIRNAMLKSQPRKNFSALKRVQKSTSLDAFGDAAELSKQVKLELTTEGGAAGDEDSSVHGGGIAEQHRAGSASHLGGLASDIKSPSMQSDDGSEIHSLSAHSTSNTAATNSAPWKNSASSKSSATPRIRRISNLGIGGFRARSTRVSQVKKSALAAASVGTVSLTDQNNAQYTIENFSSKQQQLQQQQVAGSTAASSVPASGGTGTGAGRRRQIKKKSEIDENYPDYLMQAFLGSSLLALASSTVEQQQQQQQRPSSAWTSMSGPGSGGCGSSTGLSQQHQLKLSPSERRQGPGGGGVAATTGTGGPGTGSASVMGTCPLDTRSFSSAGSIQNLNEDGEDGPGSNSFELDNDPDNLMAAQEASQFMLLEVPLAPFQQDESDSGVAVAAASSNTVNTGTGLVSHGSHGGQSGVVLSPGGVLMIGTGTGAMTTTVHQPLSAGAMIGTGVGQPGDKMAMMHQQQHLSAAQAMLGSGGNAGGSMGTTDDSLAALAGNASDDSVNNGPGGSGCHTGNNVNSSDTGDIGSVMGNFPNVGVSGGASVAATAYMGFDDDDYMIDDYLLSFPDLDVGEDASGDGLLGSTGTGDDNDDGSGPGGVHGAGPGSEAGDSGRFDSVGGQDSISVGNGGTGLSGSGGTGSMGMALGGQQRGANQHLAHHLVIHQLGDDGALTQLPELTVNDIETHLGPSSIENSGPELAASMTPSRRIFQHLDVTTGTSGVDKHQLQQLKQHQNQHQHQHQYMSVAASLAASGGMPTVITLNQHPQQQQHGGLDMAGSIRAGVGGLALQHSVVGPHMTSQQLAQSPTTVSKTPISVQIGNAGDYSSALIDLGGGNFVPNSHLMHHPNIRRQLFTSPCNNQPGRRVVSASDTAICSNNNSTSSTIGNLSGAGPSIASFQLQQQQQQVASMTVIGGPGGPSHSLQQQQQVSFSSPVRNYATDSGNCGQQPMMQQQQQHKVQFPQASQQFIMCSSSGLQKQHHQQQQQQQQQISRQITIDPDLGPASHQILLNENVGIVTIDASHHYQQQSQPIDTGNSSNTVVVTQTMIPSTTSTTIASSASHILVGRLQQDSSGGANQAPPPPPYPSNTNSVTTVTTGHNGNNQQPTDSNTIHATTCIKDSSKHQKNWVSLTTTSQNSNYQQPMADIQGGTGDSTSDTPTTANALYKSSQLSSQSSIHQSPQRNFPMQAVLQQHPTFSIGSASSSQFISNKSGSASQLMIPIGAQMDSGGTVLVDKSGLVIGNGKEAVAMMSAEHHSQTPSRPKNIPLVSSQDGTDTPSGFNSADGSTPTPSTPTAAQSNKRINQIKWQEDELLGEKSTIAPVLFANCTHSNIKNQFLDSETRFREIQKLWRKLKSDERQEWVNKSRMNKSNKKSTVSAAGSSSGASKKKKTTPTATGVPAGSTPTANSTANLQMNSPPTKYVQHQSSPAGSSIHQAPSPYQQQQQQGLISHPGGLQSPPMVQKQSQFSTFIQQQQQQQQQHGQMTINAEMININNASHSTLTKINQTSNPLQIGQMASSIGYNKYELLTSQGTDQQQFIYQHDFSGHNHGQHQHQQHQASLQMQVHALGSVSTGGNGPVSNSQVVMQTVESALRLQQQQQHQQTIISVSPQSLVDSAMVEALSSPGGGGSGGVTSLSSSSVMSGQQHPVPPHQQYLPPLPPPTWPPAISSEYPSMPAPSSSSVSTFHRYKHAAQSAAQLQQQQQQHQLGMITSSDKSHRQGGGDRPSPVSPAAQPSPHSASDVLHHHHHQQQQSVTMAAAASPSGMIKENVPAPSPSPSPLYDVGSASVAASMGSMTQDTNNKLRYIITKRNASNSSGPVGPLQSAVSVSNSNQQKQQNLLGNVATASPIANFHNQQQQHMYSGGGCGGGGGTGMSVNTGNSSTGDSLLIATGSVSIDSGLGHHSQSSSLQPMSNTGAGGGIQDHEMACMSFSTLGRLGNTVGIGNGSAGGSNVVMSPKQSPQGLQMVPVAFSSAGLGVVGATHLATDDSSGQMISSNIQRQYQYSVASQMLPQQQQQQQQQQYVIVETASDGTGTVSAAANMMGSMATKMQASNARVRQQQQKCSVGQQNKYQHQHQQEMSPQMRSPYRQQQQQQQQHMDGMVLTGCPGNSGDDCSVVTASQHTMATDSSLSSSGHHVDTRMSPVSPFASPHIQQQQQQQMTPQHKFQQPSRPVSCGQDSGGGSSQMYSPQAAIGTTGPGTPQSPCGAGGTTQTKGVPGPSSPSAKLNSRMSQQQQQQSLSPGGCNLASPATAASQLGSSPLMQFQSREHHHQQQQQCQLTTGLDYDSSTTAGQSASFSSSSGSSMTHPLTPINRDDMAAGFEPPVIVTRVNFDRKFVASTLGDNSTHDLYRHHSLLSSSSGSDSGSGYCSQSLDSTCSSSAAAGAVASSLYPSGSMQSTTQQKSPIVPSNLIGSQQHQQQQATGNARLFSRSGSSCSSNQDDCRSANTPGCSSGYMYRSVTSNNAANPPQQQQPSHLDDVIASVVSDSIAYIDDSSTAAVSQSFVAANVLQQQQRHGAGIINMNEVAISSCSLASSSAACYGGGGSGLFSATGSGPMTPGYEHSSQLHNIDMSPGGGTGTGSNDSLIGSYHHTGVSVSGRPQLSPRGGTLSGSGMVATGANQLIFNTAGNQGPTSMGLNQAGQVIGTKQSPNSFWLASSSINPSSKNQPMLIGQFANNSSKIIQHGQNLYQMYSPTNSPQQIIYTPSSSDLNSIIGSSSNDQQINMLTVTSLPNRHSGQNFQPFNSMSSQSVIGGGGGSQFQSGPLEMGQQQQQAGATLKMLSDSLMMNSEKGSGVDLQQQQMMMMRQQPSPRLQQQGNSGGVGVGMPSTMIKLNQQQQQQHHFQGMQQQHTSSVTVSKVNAGGGGNLQQQQGQIFYSHGAAGAAMIANPVNQLSTGSGNSLIMGPPVAGLRSSNTGVMTTGGQRFICSINSPGGAGGVGLGSSNTLAAVAGTSGGGGGTTGQYVISNGLTAAGHPPLSPGGGGGGSSSGGPPLGLQQQQQHHVDSATTSPATAGMCVPSPSSSSISGGNYN